MHNLLYLEGIRDSNWCSEEDISAETLHKGYFSEFAACLKGSYNGVGDVGYEEYRCSNDSLLSPRMLAIH